MEDQSKKSSFYDKLAIIGEGKDLRAYKRANDLNLNHSYKTNNFRIMDTRYGKSIAVDLDDDIWIYLPNRYTKVIQTADDINELNFTKPKIRYMGQGIYNMNLIVFEGLTETDNGKKKKKPSKKVSKDEVLLTPVLPSYAPNYQPISLPKIDEFNFDSQFPENV